MKTDRENLLTELANHSYRTSITSYWKLPSGKITDEYVDVCKALSDPNILNLACKIILNHIDETVEAIGAPMSNGLPLAIGTSFLTKNSCHPINWFGVRSFGNKEGKRRIEGEKYYTNSIAIVDDTICGGDSILNALIVIGNFSSIKNIIFLVDRMDGGLSKIREKFKNSHVEAIFTIEEIRNEFWKLENEERNKKTTKTNN